MLKQVDAKHIVEMSAALENSELGGAMRLLSRIMSTGRPIAADRAHIVAQMTAETWLDSKLAILDFFEIAGDEISHQALQHAITPSISSAPKQRLGQTAPLPIVNPARQVVVPNYPCRNAPERISIKQAAFDTMVRMCNAADQSENTARAILASLLKTWPEGDVYNAVYQAEKQGFLVDPKRWILASLKKTSLPTVRQTHQRGAIVAAPQKRHEMTTPGSVGVSQSAADKIRDKNRALKLDLTSHEGTKP
ncbi:hypothetical protein ACOI1H_16710 [Loktanella sp. DJP18]|uniref:hypothetical protein n=1 Tax=Loktanella sp. DJP18 TaxID=3409788 RepID=UPI003BB7935F